MKEKLRQLLNNDPATAGLPEDTLGTLTEDVLAMIIRAISPGNSDDALEALQHEVEEVYQSPFGISFFNLYSIENFPGKKPVTFSARKRIVRSAIETLLVEQCIDFTGDLSDVVTLSNVADGNTLKRRLMELNTLPSPDAPIN